MHNETSSPKTTQAPSVVWLVAGVLGRIHLACSHSVNALSATPHTKGPGMLAVIASNLVNVQAAHVAPPTCFPCMGHGCGGRQQGWTRMAIPGGMRWTGSEDTKAAAAGCIACMAAMGWMGMRPGDIASDIIIAACCSCSAICWCWCWYSCCCCCRCSWQNRCPCCYCSTDDTAAAH